MQATIDQNEGHLEESLSVNACLDYYLLENAIPQFHATKLQNFTNIVREMAAAEAQNNNYGASYWSKVSCQFDDQQS